MCKVRDYGKQTDWEDSSLGSIHLFCAQDSICVRAYNTHDNATAFNTNKKSFNSSFKGKSLKTERLQSRIASCSFPSNGGVGTSGV